MKGIRQDAHGYQAFLKVKGQFHSKRFPFGTKERVMLEWRENTRVLVRLNKPIADGETTFAEDAKAYLRAVQTMETIAWRTVDVNRWVDVLGGTRSRASISALEIRQWLERWRKDYSASTVNHRRTALMHLWTVLDGKSAQNPARDVPRYSSPIGPPKAIPLPAIRAMFRQMRASKTKARLMVLAWTGWPHAQIARLTPDDVRWNVAVRIAARRKGRGVGARWLPLVPQAWTALRLFKREDAWGTFSTSSMRTSLRNAATLVQEDRTIPKAIRRAVADVTPYDLRHSFLTLVALATKDDRVVAEMAMHADIRQARRYTGASVDPRVLAGMSSLRAALKGQKAS